MATVEPGPAASSNWPRIALAMLVIALIGATAYIIHLQGRLGPGQRAAAPAQAPVAAAPNAPRAAVSDAAVAGVLTPDQQRAMQERLAEAPPEQRKAWFHVQANNQNTAAVQAALQQVFEAAGWKTETVRGGFAVKSGIFLLAGEEEPPPEVRTVNAAFGAAGIDVQYLTGYRSFFTSRRQNNPNWVGPELASGQPFVIVIGSRPTPKAGQ